MNKKPISEEYKKQLIKYFFQCVLSEMSKIISFGIIFTRFNLFKEYIFALILLILLRTNGGGLHFKHYSSCFIMSFVVLALSIFLGKSVCLPNFVTYIILLTSIILAIKLVPVVSSNRPPADDKLIKKSKRNTTLILIIYFLSVCIVPMNQYLNIGIWIIVIHICQLLLAKLLERRRARNVGCNC